MSDTYSPERVVDPKFDRIWRRLELCDVCNHPVVVMCFRGTGLCSNRCKKKAARSAVSVCGQHCGEDMPGVTVHCREACCHGRVA